MAEIICVPSLVRHLLRTISEFGRLTLLPTGSVIFSLSLFEISTHNVSNQLLETAHQITLTGGIYRFLVSDYLNPLALPTGGARSGEV